MIRQKKQCELSGTYSAVMSKENGVTLNVSVDHTLRVEDRQCLQDRQADCSNLFLVHPEEGRRQVSFCLSAIFAVAFLLLFHGSIYCQGIIS